jgi:phospholipid/cholesterol/gamma-HCH transport system permease protein
MSTAGSNPPMPRFHPANLLQALGKVTWQGMLGVGNFLQFLGGLSHLFAQTMRWIVRSIVRRDTKFRFGALAVQMIRVGVRAVPIILMVQVFIGIILALQMAPTLQLYGQIERVADIVGIAIFRELGPLITAIVLSGFAGASIAAEIGSMVESEEIKALRAMALDPIHFLVVPRFLATVIMLTSLAVLADVVGAAGGMLTATTILGLPAQTYLEYTREALRLQDFFTGLIKAGVFGVLISMIACWEGLSVSGGAEGVGRATTQTVVKSIVALIATDCLFTAVFYAFNL